MKYLVILLIIGSCLTEKISVKKYELKLHTTNDDNFLGEVTIQLSNSNNADPVPLRIGNIHIHTCKYRGRTQATENRTTTTDTLTTTTTDTPTTTTTTGNPTTTTTGNPTTTTTTGNPTTTTTGNPTTTTTGNPTTTTTGNPTTTTTGTPTTTTGTSDEEMDCVYNGTAIVFSGERTTDTVILQYVGNYGPEGLNFLGSEGDRLYVAKMTSPWNIFPCQEEESAEFDVTVNDQTVISNLDALRKEDGKVPLRDVIFITGDTEIVGSANNNNIEVYAMKSFIRQMGENFKNFLTGLLQKLEKITENWEMKVLVTQFDLRANAAGFTILSYNTSYYKDSTLGFTDLGYFLMQRLFQREEGKAKTFLDVALPAFISEKVYYENIASPLNNSMVQEHRTRAFEADAFRTSVSLNLQARNFNDSDLPRDPILYSKGILIISSLMSICGEANFYEGVRKYTKKTIESDAFQICFNSTERVNQFFTTWGNYPGYPVIHVKSDGKEKYNIGQEQFLWYGKENGTKWTFRIEYKTNESTKEIWLSKDKDNAAINTDYIIFNNQNGFYRVNYDSKTWKAHMQQLKSNRDTIDEVNRAQLIDDIFSFPRSTYNFSQKVPNYVDALELLEYLKNETAYLPLKAAFNAIDFLDSALTNPLHGQFRVHIKGIVEVLFKRLNVKAHSSNGDKKLENDEIYSWACKLGVKECIENANKTFENLISKPDFWNNPSLSEKDLDVPALSSAVRNDINKWYRLHSKLSIIPSRLQRKLISILGCSNDKLTLTVLLYEYIKPETKGEFRVAVSSALKCNSDNVNASLGVITSLKYKIIQVFGENLLEDIVKLALPRLNKESAKTLSTLANSLSNGDIKKEATQAVNNVNLWNDQKAKNIKDYINGKPGAGSQAKPIALVLLLSILLPFANNIFNN